MRILLVAAPLLAAACAPSPLYVESSPGTQGEIPRDARGEPIWAQIPPPPPPASPVPVGAQLPPTR